MKRRNLNWKWLAGSVLVSAALAFGLYGLHAWQLSRLAHGLLALADQRENDGQWREAASYLDRYLRLNIQSAAIHGRLAALYANGARSVAEKTRAVALHYRALAAKPAEEELLRLRTRLGDLLLETGRFSEAEREARQTLLLHTEHPAASRVLALSLIAQIENGSLTAADAKQLQIVVSARQAWRLDAGDETLATAFALYLREQRSAIAAEFPDLTAEDVASEADACLDALVTKNPRSASAHLARFRYRTRYHLPGADEDLQLAQQFAPADEQVLLTVGAVALRDAHAARQSQATADVVTARFAAAEYAFSTLLSKEVKSKAHEAYVGRGDAELGLGQLNQAIETWREGLRQFAQPILQIVFEARIADALLQNKRLSEAGEPLRTIDQLIGRLEGAVSREERLSLLQMQDMRRACWHIQQGNAGAAIPLLQEAIARQSASKEGHESAARAWELLGQAYVASGEWTDAAVAFDRVAPLDPKSASSRLSAAFCWLRAERPDLARDRADQSLAIQFSGEAAILKATAELEYQASQPAADRSWSALEKMLTALQRETVRRELPAAWRVDLLQVDYALARAAQDHDEERGRAAAVAALELAESRNAESAEFWRRACLTYERLGVAAAADRALGRVKQLNQSAAEQAVVEARLLVARGNRQHALEELEAALASASASEQALLRLELADVALRSRDLPEAQRLLEAEVVLHPRELQLLRRLAEIALERRDSGAVRKATDLMTAIGGAGVFWARYYQALRLYTSAAGPQAPELLQALEEQTKLAVARPHWPLAFTLLGLIEQRLGHLDAAAAAYEKAIRLGERRLMVFEQLIALLDRLNRPADAEQYLSRLERRLPLSQRLTELAADHELRHENPDHALAIARAAVTNRPEDVEAHLWLARLLLTTRQTAAAEQGFRRAIELGPRDARAWMGLFSFFLRTGAVEHARTTLEDFRQKADLSSADRSLALAQGYELLGDLERAAQEYQAAADAAPDRSISHVRLARLRLQSNPQQAEKDLRKALEVDRTAVAARRMLASLLVAQNTEESLREAEALLNPSGNINTGVALDDRRLYARLLSQSPESARINHAVQILEELTGTAAGAQPADRAALARLYDQQAQRTVDAAAAATKRQLALDQLLAAANDRTAQPGQLAALIDFLLRQERTSEAATWLDKLQSQILAAAKPDPAALAQLIALRLRHGSAAACDSLLDQLATVDHDPLRPVAWRARWLVSQNRGNDVEALVEQHGAEQVDAAKDDRQQALIARTVGDIYAATNLAVLAERWYRTAAKHDAAQFPILALALARSRQVPALVSLCRDAAERDSGSQPAFVLAAALTEAGVSEQNAAVEATLEAALQAHGTETRLLSCVATYRALQGRYPEAVALYRQVVEREPKNLICLNNLAMILAETPDRRSEALATINKAIDIGGEQPGLLDTKGAILIYQGRGAQALPFLQAATREVGHDPRHRFHLAAAYQDAGDVESARHQLEQSLEQRLEEQVLTSTDRRILADLRAALFPKGESPTKANKSR